MCARAHVRVRVYVCACVCVRARACACLCVCVCARARARTRMCVCVCACVRVCVCTCVCVRVCVKGVDGVFMCKLACNVCILLTWSKAKNAMLVSIILKMLFISADFQRELLRFLLLLKTENNKGKLMIK